MEATKKSYPTDLTDSQWKLLKDLIPAAGKGGRKRTVDIRFVLNGIFYINSAGLTVNQLKLLVDWHPLKQLVLMETN